MIYVFNLFGRIRDIVLPKGCCMPGCMRHNTIVVLMQWIVAGALVLVLLIIFMCSFLSSHGDFLVDLTPFGRMAPFLGLFSILSHFIRFQY
jgi:hypothetical protein